MSLTPQQNAIIELHRDRAWHCSTEYEFIRDHRKRISELNSGYLKDKGYELRGKPCDGTPEKCKGNHSSTLFMRRAEKLHQGNPTQALKDFDAYEPIKTS